MNIKWARWIANAAIATWCTTTVCLAVKECMVWPDEVFDRPLWYLLLALACMMLWQERRRKSWKRWWTCANDWS
jgi:hypothetical protein